MAMARSDDWLIACGSILKKWSAVGKKIEIFSVRHLTETSVLIVAGGILSFESQMQILSDSS